MNDRTGKCDVLEEENAIQHFTEFSQGRRNGDVAELEWWNEVENCEKVVFRRWSKGRYGEMKIATLLQRGIEW